MSNLTTVESKEKAIGDSNNFFNVGWLVNVKQIMGESILMWPIPLSKIILCRSV
jgi:hypothetical protein